MAKVEIEAFMAENEITVDAVFVPFSRSRNKEEKNPSLNWRVTVKKKGREMITTDYSAGIAHAPSYNVNKVPKGYYGNLRMWKEDATAFEAENGFAVNLGASWGIVANKKAPILPDSCSVLWSLCMESDALNYATFEDWAGCFGYDPDSRKGEKIYRECLEIALKIRGALGESGLAALQQACEDY